MRRGEEPRIIEFDYMCKDRMITHVKVTGVKVEIQNFSDFAPERPFGIHLKPKYENFLYLLEQRCMPETRPNKREVLCGIEYDRLRIIRRTHGVMAQDTYWMRFGGEKITWNNVKIKGWHK